MHVKRLLISRKAWLVEAWRRTDPRIQYHDIIDRQTEDDALGLQKLTTNALSNQVKRGWRKVTGSWVEYCKRKEPHKADLESLEKLTLHNLISNSLLQPCEFAHDRLQRVRIFRGEDNNNNDGQGHFHLEPLEVTLENLEETTLPGDYFTKHLSKDKVQKLGTMTIGMSEAFSCLIDLQERAELHGIEDWRNLPPICLPRSWFDRTRYAKSAKSVKRKDFIHDGECEICVWSPKRKVASPRGVQEEVPVAGTKRKRSRKSTASAESEGSVDSPAKRFSRRNQQREPTPPHETHSDSADDLAMELGNDSTSFLDGMAFLDDSAQGSGLVGDGHRFSDIEDFNGPAVINEDEATIGSVSHSNVAVNGEMYELQRFTPASNSAPPPVNTAQMFSSLPNMAATNRSRHGTDDFLASRSTYPSLPSGAVPWGRFCTLMQNSVITDEMIDPLLR